MPQHCIAPHCQEHYASGAANGRNVARHRDNNTVYLHCYVLPNVTLCRNVARLSAREIHLSNVLRRQVDLSVASKVLKPFANYATAHHQSCNEYRMALLERTATIYWSQTWSWGYLWKRYNDVMVLDERERMRKEKRNWRETCLVLYRQVDIWVILIFWFF